MKSRRTGYCANPSKRHGKIQSIGRFHETFTFRFRREAETSTHIFKQRFSMFERVIRVLARAMSFPHHRTAAKNDDRQQDRKNDEQSSRED